MCLSFSLSLSLSVVARQLIKICGRCFIIFRVDTLIQFKFDASRGRHIIDLNYICMLYGVLALSRSLPLSLSRFLYRSLHLCVAHTSCRALPCFNGSLWLCLRIDCLQLQSLKRHLLSHTHTRTHTPILIMSKNGKKINNNLLRLRAVAAKASLINLWDCNFGIITSVSFQSVSIPTCSSYPTCPTPMLTINIVWFIAA